MDISIDEAESILLASMSEAVAKARGLKFNRSEIIDQLAVGLFLSVIERSVSLRILMSHKRLDDSKTILRGILESYVEMLNLIRQPDFASNSQYELVCGIIKKLEEFSNENPYLYAEEINFDPEKELGIQRKRKKELEDRGAKKISIRDKFIAVGMEEQYYSVYKHLCDATHAGYAGIIGRNFEVDASKGEFEIALGIEPAEDSMRIVYLQAANLLKKSTEQVHDYFANTRPIES